MWHLKLHIKLALKSMRKEEMGSWGGVTTQVKSRLRLLPDLIGH